MAPRFRKIDPRFWKDEKIRAMPLSHKGLALYLFTGQSNRIGLFSFSPGEALEDLDISSQTFREGFGKVCLNLNLGWDETSRVLYLPTWWKYNCPDNVNVLKGCLKDIHDVPKNTLYPMFYSNTEHLPPYLHPTFLEGLPKPYPKPSPIQEQEQEQEKGAGAGTEVGAELNRVQSALSTLDPSLESWLLTTKHLQGLANGKNGDLWRSLERAYDQYPWLFFEDEIKKADAWMEANPSRRPTERGLPRFIRNWMERAVEMGRKRHAEGKAKK
jgi:hypothetical protein